MRAREDARQDQLRARHRLGKFLLRHGWRPPDDVKKNWTHKTSDLDQRVKSISTSRRWQAAFLDYVHEVEHAAERIAAAGEVHR